MIISINNIKSSHYSLSSSMYRKGSIVNNGEPISTFIKKDPKHGTDPSTKDRYSESPLKLLKAKGLTRYSSIPIMYGKSIDGLKPSVFVNQHLHKHDLLISKDSNIGNSVMLDKNYPNVMLSGALYRPLFKSDLDKWFIFAYLLSNKYHNQLNSIVPMGATIRHAGANVFKVKIPQKIINNDKKILAKLSYQIVINDELNKKIYQNIINYFESLLHFRHDNSSTHIININTIKKTWRMDSNFYNPVMQSYRKMCSDTPTKSITQLGFILPRGQNLQRSSIGLSKSSSKPFINCSLLLLPGNISREGFPTKYSYFGNHHKLKMLKPGDILFGAKGTNRSFIIPNNITALTNIDSLMIRSKKSNNGITPTIVTIKYILDYYRECNILTNISVGGRGGSLAKKYWKYIRFPILSNTVKNKLFKYYISSLNRWTQRNKDINKINDIINKA